MSFGEYIKSKRKEKGLSLREVSKRSGISHPYLSQLENERSKKPTPETIKKISKGLEVPYMDLMEKADVIDLKDWYLEKLKNPYSKNEFDDLLIAKSKGYSSVGEMRDQQNELSKILSIGYAIRDLKVFLKLNVEDEIGSIIYPVYNGHKLTKDECQRILDVLVAIFPEYSKEKGED